MTPRLSAGLALVSRDGRVLLLRRSQRVKSHRGAWNLPGGEIDPGETARDAAAREAFEEAGYDHRTHRAQVQWLHDTPLYTTVVATLVGRSPAPKLNWESDQWLWVTREQALGLNLHPGLRTFFESVTDDFQPRAGGRGARGRKVPTKESAIPYDDACPYLFHVTPFSALPTIAAHGLRVDYAGSLCRNHAWNCKGRVFFADGWDAAKGWYHHHEEALDERIGDVEPWMWEDEPENLEGRIPVVLRLLRRPRNLHVDTYGESRVKGSVWTDRPIPPSALVYWSPPQGDDPGQWRPLWEWDGREDPNQGVDHWEDEDGARWPVLKETYDEAGFFPADEAAACAPIRGRANRGAENPDCAWCGGECSKQYRNRHGEVFCSASHRSSSNRARKRLTDPKRGRGARPTVVEGDEVILTRAGLKKLAGRLTDGGTTGFAQVTTHRGANGLEIRFKGTRTKWARLSPVWVTLADVKLSQAQRALRADQRAKDKAQRELRKVYGKRGAFDFFDHIRAGAVQIGKGVLHHTESGYEIGIRSIGKGHASEAFLADDGWVYIFTNEDARDPAKEVLHESVSKHQTWRGRQKPLLRHLPKIEAVGHGSTARRSGFVWRMPKYAPARGEAGRHGRVLAALYQKSSGPIHGDFVKRVKAAHKAKKIPKALAAAVEELAVRAQTYNGAWAFEFPPRNLMQDSKGNLILLDVIYDREAVIERWMK